MKFHNTQTDQHGVNLDRLNADDERIYNKDFGSIPFRAIIVAYYGKSQMVDVIYPRDGGTGFLSGVDVYGNHGDLLGELTTPDIAVEKSEDGYNIDPPQSGGRVEIGERKNNIECIVQRTTDGFCTSQFRSLHESNPMWLNSKAGRTIRSYSDGSYYVCDKDGNSEFVHPGGLRIKIGDSPDTIVMEADMPVHKNNQAKYPTKTHYLIEHPAGAKFGIDNTGKLISENGIGKVGTDILIAIHGIIEGIITNGGTNPNPTLLATLKTKIEGMYT